MLEARGLTKSYGHIAAVRQVSFAIKPGETDTSGTFTLLEVECLGACDRAPVVMVNDAWHERLNPEDASKLVDDLKSLGETALSGCHLVVERQTR